MPADLAALVAKLAADVAADDLSSLELVEAIVDRARADQTKRITEWLRSFTVAASRDYERGWMAAAAAVSDEFRGPDAAERAEGDVNESP